MVGHEQVLLAIVELTCIRGAARVSRGDPHGAASSGQVIRFAAARLSRATSGARSRGRQAVVSVSLQRSSPECLRDAVTRVHSYESAPVLRPLEQPGASDRLPAWRRMTEEPERRIAAMRPAGQIRDLGLRNACSVQRPVRTRAGAIAGWDVRRLLLILPTFTYARSRLLLLAAQVLAGSLLLDANSAATRSVATFTAPQGRHRGRRSDGADA